MSRIFRLCLLLLISASMIAAQNTIVPIVHLNVSDQESANNWSYLLGGVENGKFVDAKTTFAKMQRGERFSLFDFVKGKTGEFSLGEFKAGPGACEENYFAESEITAATNFAVGANAKWEVLPRKWQAANASDANYKKAVADVLRVRGLSKSPVKIARAVRVDLDGDGADESILLANYAAGRSDSSDPQPGSYSMLLLQKNAGKKAQTAIVGASFLTKKDGSYGGEYSLSGIADLNGDGKMEVIVEITAYEEGWIKIFELKAGKLTEIKALSYYCGV